jgi:hypothetical protein
VAVPSGAPAHSAASANRAQSVANPRLVTAILRAQPVVSPAALVVAPEKVVWSGSDTRWREWIEHDGEILKAAKVRSIKFHGMRHTSATLALKAGVPIHVVQQRLGHSRVEMTLSIYPHVLPSMQADAAPKLGAAPARVVINS